MFKDKIDFENIDIKMLSDSDLMNLKFDCMECQNGYYLKKVENEINRRFKNE